MIICNQIIQLLSKYKFPLENEKKLQTIVEKILLDNNIDYIREMRLTSKDIVDFFINSIALEVKIKGNKKSIYNQCLRYIRNDKVKSLILLTNKSMNLPNQIEGKPCYIINLGRAWL